MKSNLLICFVIICILASLCIYQTIKKEDIYISFKDLNGFKYQFIDSTDVLKTGKVLINQEGKFKNHFWEINIDSPNIKKAEANRIQRLIINSKFFIINNFGFYPNENGHLHKTDKYRIYIIRQEKDVQYILPVKEVNFLISIGGSE